MGKILEPSFAFDTLSLKLTESCVERKMSPSFVYTTLLTTFVSIMFNELSAT
jgi:hypothetical protein